MRFAQFRSPSGIAVFINTTLPSGGKANTVATNGTTNTANGVFEYVVYVADTNNHCIRKVVQFPARKHFSFAVRFVKQHEYGDTIDFLFAPQILLCPVSQQ